MRSTRKRCHDTSTKSSLEHASTAMLPAGAIVPSGHLRQHRGAQARASGRALHKPWDSLGAGARVHAAAGTNG